MWNQVYDPLANEFLSTLVAAIPVVVLLALIASGKVKAHVAAVIALGAAIVIAIWGFTMPTGLALRASVLGLVTGFFPIGWIVLNVLFLYRLCVEKGSFELVQRVVGGSARAGPGALLMGLVFSPLAAAGLSLIANTAPVAYGALGTPIQGLATVTGFDPYILGAMVGRALTVFSLLR